MKTIIYLSLFFSYVCGGQSPYQKFQTYMNANEGYLLNIKISQSQINQHFNSAGTLYYFQNKEYVFDSMKERITYKNGTIKTVNKVEKQIIYDSDIENNLNIFDLFSFKENRIEIKDSFIENEMQIIIFSLDDWGINAKMWTNPITGKPKRILINLSVDESISLDIISSKIASKMEVPIIDVNDYEIIDLRE